MIFVKIFQIWGGFPILHLWTLFSWWTARSSSPRCASSSSPSSPPTGCSSPSGHSLDSPLLPTSHSPGANISHIVKDIFWGGTCGKHFAILCSRHIFWNITCLDLACIKHCSYPTRMVSLYHQQTSNKINRYGVIFSNCNSPTNRSQPSRKHCELWYLCILCFNSMQRQILNHHSQPSPPSPPAFPLLLHPPYQA